MAKKDLVSFVCQNCMSTFNQWSGRCPRCLEWNTLEEQVLLVKDNSKVKLGKPLGASSLENSLNHNIRYPVGFDDIDLVLGGGLLAGSVILLTGQPGIGKSTLILQMAINIAESKKVLYVSAEETIYQVNQRKNRLNSNNQNLIISNSNLTDDIVASIETTEYDLLIVDSIQTISCSWVNSSAGSIGQISNSAQAIISSAKNTNTAVIIVGHVTKDGNIAGPKLLEHMVDVVLLLEGDRYGGFKLLRTTKNRFGSTNEVAIFEMTASGFKIIENPSEILLDERSETDGSIVTATIEGSRPILVEVQALVSNSNFGYPKRTASGFDINRLNLLIAVIEQRTKLKLGSKDVYINVVGGINLNEPAADLAICLAIISALLAKKLNKNYVIFGEVGLSGEVRHVSYNEKRLNEALKLGFDGCLGPKLRNEKLVKYYPVKNLAQIVTTYF